MNWIDFNILCIGEKKPKICKSEVFSTEIMNKNRTAAGSAMLKIGIFSITYRASGMRFGQRKKNSILS